MIPAWAVFDAAADLAEEVVAHAFGLPARKQQTQNPLEDDEFEGILKSLFGSILRVVEPEDRRALQTVQTMLDLNWPGMSEAERERALQKIGVALGGVPNVVVQKVDKVLALQGPQIVVATKQASAATFDLPISPSFNLVDQRVIEAARRSHAHYIRNEYGVREERASAVARDIVSKGLARGLDRYAIAEELEPAMAALGVTRSRGYFQMVSSVYAARARTWGQIAAFDEAAIEYMEWMSVLDESTSDVCRYLDGKVFPVAAARQRHEAVADSEDPESVVELQPWVSTGKAENGAMALYYKREGKRIPIATVERSGVGAKDDRGEFSRGASVDALVKAGITSPPAHAHCRSLLVPASEVGASAQVPANAPVGPPAATPGKILPYVSFPTQPVPAGPEASPQEKLTWGRPVRPQPAGFNPEALPEHTAAELAEIAAAEAKRKAIEQALAKLQALPKLGTGEVASPLPTVASLGPGHAPPKPNKVQIAGGKKKKPVPVVVDQVHGLDGFQEKWAAPAVQLFDPNEPVLLVKHDGVLTPASAAESYKLLAAKLHGHVTLPAKIIDLDKAAAKKLKKAPAAAAPPPSQPPDTLPSPPPAPPRPPTLSAPPPKGDAKNILHKQTGAKQGSNEGGFYEGADGVARYVKFYNEAGKAECEHLANAIYRDLGHTAPESVLFDHNGKLAFASKIIPGAKTLREVGHSAERSKKILEGFVADVLTANWDVVGVGNNGGDDNVVFLPDGSVARIDNGGSLLMRGLTGRKPNAVLNAITEWDKLFDPGVNFNYSRMAKAAGVTCAEDMKDVALAGIDKVLALEKAAGGWTGYVDRLVPGLASSDRSRIAEMLTARTKLLAEKAEEMRRPPPAPGQARFTAKQYSNVAPRAGLRLSELPETEVIEDHYKKISRSNPTKMPSGEKYTEYRKRAEAAVKGMPADAVSAIRDFTGNGYTPIRDSEERGAPDSRSEAILKALKKAPAEPGTVWRGIQELPEFVITKHLENGILQLGKKGGATSSSSWLIDVSIDSFMGGPGDGRPGGFKILYKLNGKTQVPVETISSVGDTERELMLARDAVFRVTGLSRPKGRKHVLVVEAEELVGAERDAALAGRGGGGPGSSPSPTPTLPPPATPKDKVLAQVAALPTKAGPKGPEVLHGLPSFSAQSPPPVHPSTVPKDKVDAAKTQPPVLVSPSMITMHADSVPHDDVAAMVDGVLDGSDPPIVLVQSGGKLYLKTPQIWSSTVVAHAQAGKPFKAQVVNLDGPNAQAKVFPPVTADQKASAKAKLAQLLETAPGKVTHPAASHHFTPVEPAPVLPSTVPQKKIDDAKKKPPVMIDPAAITLWEADVTASSLQIAVEHLPTNGVVIPLIKANGKLYPMKQMYDAVVGSFALMGKPVPAHIVDMD